MKSSDEKRARAKQLRKWAEMLEKAADLEDAVPDLDLPEKGGNATKARRSIKRTRKPPTNTPRMEQIRAMLRANGPLMRGEIFELSDIPLGTLAGYLKESNGLVHMDDGKWAVPDNLGEKKGVTNDAADNS